MAEFNFKADVNDAEEMSFDCIPAGDYIAVIDDSDIKQTKKGDGTYLSLRYSIVDGEYEGRKIFENITLSNPSQKATAIGNRQKNALMVALDKMEATDTEEFHNIPLVISVIIKKSAEYGDKNEIKKHSPLSGAVQTEAKKEKSTAKKDQPWKK